MRRIQQKTINKNSVYKVEEWSDPAFSLLLDYVIGQGFAIDANYRIAVTNMWMDKIFWRPTRPLFAPLKGKKTDGHEIIHVGLHHLLTQKFKVKFKGAPQLHLFNEALATAINLYFTLVYFEKHGPNHFFASTQIKLFEEFSKKQGKPLLNSFNRAAKNPFKAFKIHAAEVFQVGNFALELLKTADSYQDYRFASEFKKMTKAMPYWVFSSRYDYSTFAYWILHNCGPRSTASDLKSLNDLQNILKNSHSMEDFLLALGVKL